MRINLRKDVVYKGKKLVFKEYIQKMKKLSEDMIEFLKSNESKWNVNKELQKKFSKQGKALQFFGDTIVIPVNEEAANQALNIQKIMYDEIGDMLSEKLRKEFFHITIHDLNNELEDWKDKTELKNKVKENKSKCKEIFFQIADYLMEIPGDSKIDLIGSGIIGESVALSIAAIPSDERSFKILLNLHNLFENIVPLDKHFFPHLTLGYYKPIEFSKDDMERLVGCVVKLNKISRILFELDLWELSYQIFDNMNHYRTVFKLCDFIKECKREV